jgi:hypothetical protein
VGLGSGCGSAAGTGSRHSIPLDAWLRLPLQGRGNGDRYGRGDRPGYIFTIPFAFTIPFTFPFTFPIAIAYGDVCPHKHTNGHADTDTHSQTYPHPDRHTRKLAQPLPDGNVWGHGDAKGDEHTPAHFTSGIRCPDHLRAVG